MSQWAIKLDETTNSENSREELLAIEAEAQKVEALRQQISEANMQSEAAGEASMFVPATSLTVEPTVEVIDKVISLFKTGADAEKLAEMFGENILGVTGEMVRNEVSIKKNQKKLEELASVLEAIKTQQHHEVTHGQDRNNKISALETLTVSLRSNLNPRPVETNQQVLNNSQIEMQRQSQLRGQEAVRAGEVVNRVNQANLSAQLEASRIQQANQAGRVNQANQAIQVQSLVQVSQQIQASAREAVQVMSRANESIKAASQQAVTTSEQSRITAAQRQNHANAAALVESSVKLSQTVDPVQINRQADNVSLRVSESVANLGRLRQEISQNPAQQQQVQRLDQNIASLKTIENRVQQSQQAARQAEIASRASQRATEVTQLQPKPATVEPEKIKPVEQLRPDVKDLPKEPKAIEEPKQKPEKLEKEKVEKPIEEKSIPKLEPLINKKENDGLDPIQPPVNPPGQNLPPNNPSGTIPPDQRPDPINKEPENPPQKNLDDILKDIKNRQKANGERPPSKPYSSSACKDCPHRGACGGKCGAINNVDPVNDKQKGRN